MLSKAQEDRLRIAVVSLELARRWGPENYGPWVALELPRASGNVSLMPLQPQETAPDFVLRTKNEQGLADVRLSDFRGQKVVLLFFPAAFTGVCTQEFCDISGGVHAFPGAQVLGISVDLPFSQEAWAKANHITVPLLSDARREVSEAYDVLCPDLAGCGPTSARAAFVIDEQGMIVHSEETANPGELPDFAAIVAALG
jgi:glutaredoxin-dependent peroxiredoxin